MYSQKKETQQKESQMHQHQMPQHKVIIAGFGPGNIDLIPFKTLRCIQTADVIVYDSLIDTEILELAKPDCNKIYMGKRCGHHSAKQEEINTTLIKLSKEFATVLRLKGGDPFVFGRGGEEALALKEAHVNFEIIPAPTSFIAGPAFAGIPVTHRNVAVSFAVITGHESKEKDFSQHQWKAYAGIDTLVFLMGVTNRQSIAKNLIDNGRNPSEPVAFVENATLKTQKIKKTNLESLAKNPLEVFSPAIMIVGPVVDLNLEWFDPTQSTSIQEIHQFLQHAPNRS